MAKKKRPAPDTGRATEEMLTDSDALDQIRGLLASRPWDAEAVGQIAMFLRETGREVEESEGGLKLDEPDEDEFGTGDEGDEGWLYGDVDPSEYDELTIESSAYARISRIAGADDPLRCPNCKGDAEWAEVGARINCLFCGYDGPPAAGAAPRPPAMAPKPTGKCPNCGKPVWDQAGPDQRLNKCWGCGQRFDTAEPEAAEASADLTGEQLAALKSDFIAWSGGFEPAEMTDEEISTFIDAAMDTNLDRDKAVEALRAWRAASS